VSTTDGPGERQDDAENLLAKMKKFRQGDVVLIRELPVIGDDGSVELRQALRGAVVISQTCDLVQPDRPTVQLVPLVDLDPDTARDAARGKRPRFVAVPSYGQNMFADLQVVGTVTKQYLSHFERRPGVSADGAAGSVFGRAVGRKFSRFPFPDEIHPWIKPLRELLQSRAGRETSPLGQIIESIAAIRLESAGGWRSHGPYDLTLVIILHPGVLPELDDEFDELPIEIRDWAYQDGRLMRQSAQVAEKLRSASGGAVQHLWNIFGESLGEKCRENGRRHPLYSSAVESLEVEIVSSDEFTFDRFQRSEEVDLDHLSPPVPF
jgi:hypothetical protein